MFFLGIVMCVACFGAAAFGGTSSDEGFKVSEPGRNLLLKESESTNWMSILLWFLCIASGFIAVTQRVTMKECELSALRTWRKMKDRIKKTKSS